jgi:hypothetical protein
MVDLINVDMLAYRLANLLEKLEHMPIVESQYKHGIAFKPNSDFKLL